MIGSQFCAQCLQQRLTRASSGRSNPIVRFPLECGCSRWLERERGRDGFAIRGRGNSLLPLICLAQVSVFYFACIFFYCYFPMPDLYLAGGLILPLFNLFCLQGAHSRISCLLGTEVYFWFWLNQSLFSVGFSRLSGICHFTGGAFSRFTLHSFSSKRSEFSEYTSFLCSFILFPS